MKNFKKNISLSVSLAMLFMLILAIPVSADDDVVDAMTRGYYIPFSGIVKEINNYNESQGEEDDSRIFVLVENDYGAKLMFVITDETYIIGELNELAVDSEFTGFYDANVPVPMIYPPQHRAIVIALDMGDGQSVKADRFNEELISDDNTLKLNIGEKTEIIYQDGTEFEGDISELANRKLIVVYDISTRSIPAQTTPSSVIILYEKVVPPIADLILTDGEMGVFIDGVKIESPTPYFDVASFVPMVPLRAVAEALGYEVVWIAETQSIMLDDIVFLTLDDPIILVEDKPIKLTMPPLLVDNQYTYVSLELFGTILGHTNILVTSAP